MVWVSYDLVFCLHLCVYLRAYLLCYCIYKGDLGITQNLFKGLAKDFLDIYKLFRGYLGLI